LPDLSFLQIVIRALVLTNGLPGCFSDPVRLAMHVLLKIKQFGTCQLIRYGALNDFPIVVLDSSRTSLVQHILALGVRIFLKYAVCFIFKFFRDWVYALKRKKPSSISLDSAELDDY
jgi:hypothetical protein